MSDEELRVLFASIAEEHKKTEAAQQKTEAALASLAEEHKKTEAAQQKTEAALVSLAEEHKKTEAAIREIHKELGGVGRTQGDIAEDLFRRSTAKLLQDRGIAVEELKHNLRTPNAEFDLLFINGKLLVLTEVKSRLHFSDIDTLIYKQIPAFKRYFGDDYKGRKIIGALASLAVDADLEKQVEAAGLFLFTQTKEGGASLANSPDFKPRFY